MPTSVETKVIAILTEHKPCRDAWHEPIHAVDKAMGWTNEDTRLFVKDLIARRLIKVASNDRREAAYHPESHWEKEQPE